ncbi:baseplate assembly protein [Roseibium polysiphoniae]|uniref:baseplate assembly protein n=1 Tax=Roseibium polysiphoniae TaxID=2571221 RepID=UPI003298F68B
MHEIIVGMKLDFEMLKTSMGNALRVGPIADVDPQKGYRIKLAEGDDGPVLSPWYPHPESGGQTRSWVPLTKGQVVGVMHPHGDQRQGVMFRAGFSGQTQPPSEDLAANILKAFGITLTMKDGKVTLEGDFEVKGNVRLVGDVDFEAGHVQHNGTNVGDTHVHSGVVPGGADTKEPH